MRGTSVTDLVRFRIKVRDAEPISIQSGETTSEGSGEDSGPLSLASSLLNSLADIASDLEPAVGLAQGNRAPDFSLTTLDDESVTLSSLRDRVVLLNFWGTWCGPCRREMPEFQKAYQEWREKGFEILAIAYNDTEAAMSDFRDEFGLTFALALDDTGEINDAYGIQTRPSSYLLGPGGIILARHFGIMTEDQLNEMLNKAFAEA